MEWRGFAIKIHEDEIFPSVDTDGDETIILAVEIADTFEFDRALEGAVVAVGPAVIRAAELLGATGGFRNDGGGVVSADVVEGAKLAIFAAGDE